MKNLLKNWKTTSAGVTMIVTAVVHLVFTHKTADENTWTVSLLAVVGGIGLMFAGDSSQSQKDMVVMKDMTASAVETRDTTELRKDEVKPTPESAEKKDK